MRTLVRFSFFFFSSRRRHTRYWRDWSSDVCSSDLRFLTVPDAKAARRSIIVATWIIGGFYLLTPILGYGAALLVGRDRIEQADPGGNLAAPLLAEALGGPIFLAFISAVAFATIVAEIGRAHV